MNHQSCSLIFIVIAMYCTAADMHPRFELEGLISPQTNQGIFLGLENHVYDNEFVY